MDDRRFPPRALEQRGWQGWRRDGAAAGDDRHACSFLPASGQSAYNRYKLQCRGNRLHNVALPPATDASSSFTLQYLTSFPPRLNPL